MKPATLMPQRQSLVAQVVEILSHKIRAGEYSERLPPERHLCQDLQISRKTLAAAERQLQHLGWIKSSPTGRKLIGQRVQRRASACSKVVLLGSKPIARSEQYLLRVFDTLQQKLHQAGLAFEEITSPRFAQNDCSQTLAQLLHDSPRTAWLLYGVQEQTQRWFSERNIPALVFGSTSPAVNLPSLDNDHAASMQHAVDVLVAKGHRRLVLFLPRLEFIGDQLSEQSYLAEAARHPGANISALVVRHDGSVTGICQAIEKLPRGRNRPTAMIVAYPYHVITVVCCLQRLGWRIPDDLSLISRDDEASLEYIVPRLARYAIDPMKVARQLTRVAVRLAMGEKLSTRPNLILPRYLPGATVGAPPRMR